MKVFGGVCNHAGFMNNDACEHLAAWSPELKREELLKQTPDVSMTSGWLSAQREQSGCILDSSWKFYNGYFLILPYPWGEGSVPNAAL